MSIQQHKNNVLRLCREWLKEVKAIKTNGNYYEADEKKEELIDAIDEMVIQEGSDGDGEEMVIQEGSDGDGEEMSIEKT